MKKTRYITQAAVIAALYVALTFIFSFISYGQLQIRVAEALTVLPAFTPAAIPGLFIGCIISNTLGPNGLADIIIGSLTTLAAAWLSRKASKSILVPLPPVLLNAVIIGLMLHFLYNLPLVATMLWIAAGQAVACYGIGYPLMMVVRRWKLL